MMTDTYACHAHFLAETVWSVAAVEALNGALIHGLRVCVCKMKI